MSSPLDLGDPVKYCHTRVQVDQYLVEQDLVDGGLGWFDVIDRENGQKEIGEVSAKTETLQRDSHDGNLRGMSIQRACDEKGKDLSG